MRELVSIIMPSYNSEKYIKESIESVISQTYENWELIIVDDCSSDNTVEIIKSFDDERIKFFINEKNSGAAVSRNKALREAKGKWVAFLDSDDVWLPQKLKKQMGFMTDNGYHFSYTVYEIVSETGESLNVMVSGPDVVNKRKMYGFCYPGCLTVMYDAEYVGQIQIADIKKNNDYAMWLKVIEKADCYKLNECLAYYRRHEGSVSSGSKLKLIKHHYIMFRKALNKNPLTSFVYTLRNLYFGFLKKIRYTKKKSIDKNGIV